jgi:hypothetical protein
VFIPETGNNLIGFQMFRFQVSGIRDQVSEEVTGRFAPANWLVIARAEGPWQSSSFIAAQSAANWLVIPAQAGIQFVPAARSAGNFL